MATAQTQTKTPEKAPTPPAPPLAQEQKPGGALTQGNGSGTGTAVSNRAARLAADAGKGVSRDRDDKFVPMIRVLQAQSPQCLRAKPEFIPGAEAGDFYLKNTLTPVIKGGEGIEFIPCAFLRCWLEFDGPRDEKPNFVGRVEDQKGKPAVALAEWELDEDGYDWVHTKAQDQKERNNRLSFSREHYGLVDGRPFVMPFGGSGHTTSREWQTLMDQFLLPDGRPEPSFNRKYSLKTVPRSNASGDWYAVQVQHLGEVSDEEYDRAGALHAAVMSGAQVAEAPDDSKAEAGKDVNAAGI